MFGLKVSLYNSSFLLLDCSIPLLIQGSMYLHLAEIHTVSTGATSSIMLLILLLKMLKFSLALLLLRIPYQSTFDNSFFIFRSLSLFSDLLSKVEGCLSSILVCFRRHSSGRWSDIADTNIAES